MAKPRNDRTANGPLWAGLALALAFIAFGGAGRVAAQVFDSGSDGSDGALAVAPNQGTIVFDPPDTARWGRVLDPDGDGVYNFTTITIGSGTTLKLSGDKVNKAVYFLASGDVAINGIVDLTGGSGIQTSDVGLRRQVTIPGSGGYAGGAGGNAGSSFAPTPGEGPGGGAGGVTGCSFFNASTLRRCGMGGTFTGNRYLVPLIGGSGGEGALSDNGFFYSGGAGGGAILIASSTSITLVGSILAGGGAGGQFFLGGNSFPSAGGGGSGGGIRLVAPVLSGNGHLNVNGAAVSGTAGWVRLEGFQISSSFTLDSGGGVVTRGSPIDPTTLRPANSIRVTAIDGVQVPANPTGSFVLPDVSISKDGPVNVDIQATGIPNGTVVTLQVYPQTPTDSTTVNLPTAQATLSGTLQSSTATATFTFPYGFSRGFVRGTWTP